MQDYTETSSLLDHDSNNERHYTTRAEDRIPGATLNVTKKRTWRNLLMLCVAFTIVFTGVTSLLILDRFTDITGELRFTSLTSLYAGLVISCFFSPLVIRILGCKYIFVIGFCCYALYVASHFYQRTYTVIPTAVLVGVASGNVASSQGVFMNGLAINYAAATHSSMETSLSLFTGIFFAFFQTPYVWGNIIISSLVSNSSNETNTTAGTNKTCGAKFCTENSTPLPEISTSPTVLSIIVGLFTAFCIIGALITSFGVDRFREKEQRRNELTSWKTAILSVVYVHPYRWLCFLPPLFLYTGMQRSFFVSEYTEAFLSCQLGVSSVGYSMVGYAAASLFGSPVFGYLERYVGRPPLITGAAVINAGLLLLLKLWSPELHPEYLLYIIPVLWGLADAVWMTTVSAFVGGSFTQVQEPAFAMLRMWHAIGLTVIFVISQLICMDIKIYILISVLVISLLLYVVAERGLKSDKSRPWMDLYDVII